jgi:hypothetical protein
MVKNCQQYGLAPLSREQFDAEDQRMLVELVRRRNGLKDVYVHEEPPVSPLWGVYR